MCPAINCGPHAVLVHCSVVCTGTTICSSLGAVNSLLLRLCSTAALDAIWTLAHYHLEQLSQLLAALAGFSISSILVLSLLADICITSNNLNSTSWPSSPDVLSCTDQALQPNCMPNNLQARTRQRFTDRHFLGPQHVAVMLYAGRQWGIRMHHAAAASPMQPCDVMPSRSLSTGSR